MRKSKPDPTSSKKGSLPNITSWIYQNLKYILPLIVLLTGTIFFYVIYSAPSYPILPLLNTDLNTLKKIFSSTSLSSSPSSSPSSTSPTLYIHYCYDHTLPTTSKDYIPMKLSQAHPLLGSKYTVTILNCSQVLPNNQTISQRFKLNLKWKPTIFTAVPWGPPTQIPPLSLKESQSIANFIQTATKPKPLIVKNNHEFHSGCKFNQTKSSSSSSSSSAAATSPTLCLIVMKGQRYNEYQDEIMRSMVEKYYKYHVMMIDATERRFSFEKSLPSSPTLNPQNYALRVYMIRDGTHYLMMNDSPTWENIQLFVNQAIQAPLSGYEIADTNEIKLVKPMTASSSQRKSRRESEQKMKMDDESESSSKSSNKEQNEAEEQEDEDEEEVIDQLQQQRREQQRREQMEREAKEYLFGDDDHEEEKESKGGSDDLKEKKRKHNDEREDKEVEEDCQMDDMDDHEDVIEL